MKTGVQIRIDVHNLQVGVDGMRGDVQGLRSDMHGLRGEVHHLQENIDALHYKLDKSTMERLMEVLTLRKVPIDQDVDEPAGAVDEKHIESELPSYHAVTIEKDAHAMVT